MLPCVCSVIDHRWRQNVVRTKKVAHEAIAECVTDVLTTFWRLLWSIIEQTHGNMESTCFYIITKQTTTDKAFFISKSFNITRKPAFASLWRTRKKAIWRNLLSIQNEAISLVAMRRKELWLVQENHATVKLDSSVTSRGMKTYSESRIEMRNLQILKKILSSHFLSSKELFEPKSLEVALNIAGVEQIRSGNLSLWSTRRPFDSIFELCPLWLVILKSVWNSVRDTL